MYSDSQKTNNRDDLITSSTSCPCDCPPPAVELVNVSFTYGDTPIFKDLSLCIDSDDFVGLIGANGSGKSTLVKLILGLLKPSSGEILLYGQPQASFKNWSGIGYVSQKAASFNTSFPGTVNEVIMANLISQIGMFRRPQKIHKDMVEEALCKVGMQDYKNRLIGQLSGGQQQRVFLARVLVNNPSMVFLDEPTAGVDGRSEGEIYNLLHELNSKGLGIVLVSHDISAITSYARRLICLGADGIFEHDTKTPVPGNFLHRLYGYNVVAHSHFHNENTGLGTESNCIYCDHFQHNHCCKQHDTEHDKGDEK